MSTTAEKLRQVYDIKNAIAETIRGKGVDISGKSFADYSGLIGDNLGLVTGLDAAAADVIAGKTFYGSGGRETGSMPESTVTQEGSTATVTAGHLAETVTLRGGMPVIPESDWTTLTKGATYTAAADGWLRYSLAFSDRTFYGGRSTLTLSYGGGSASIMVGGESSDDSEKVLLDCSGYFPVRSGETYGYTYTGRDSDATVQFHAI